MELRMVKKFVAAEIPASPLASYIRRHYSDLLGEDIALLDEPGGIEELQKRCRRRCIELGRMRRRAA